MRTLKESENIDLLEDYNSKGWCKVMSLFSSNEVNAIRVEVQRFMKDEASNLGSRDINFADKDKKIVNSIHNLANHPENYFSKLLHSSELTGIAQTFMHGIAIARKVEMFAKPARIGMGSPIHQDNFYWCLKPYEVGYGLTMWVAIDSSGPENGGVTYLNGTQSLGLFDHKNSYAPGSSQTVADADKLLKKFEQTTPSLKPGDVLIHDAHVVHLSEPNTSDQSRSGVTFQYQSSEAVLDSQRMEDYEENLSKQMFKR